MIQHEKGEEGNNCCGVCLCVCMSVLRSGALPLQLSHIMLLLVRVSLSPLFQYFMF